MSFDVRREKWIPFRRRSGTVEWTDPSQIADVLGADPIVALATPRPDIDGAITEFLVGLLAVAMQPADEAQWRVWWDTPPTPAELQARLDKLPPAFDLEGDGPRFFQDLSAFDFAAESPTPIGQILIDAPGGQTEKLNKDLFVKRASPGKAPCFSRAAAAMALVTLQTYAPAGGRGIRTSLRGGGPLTTLVDPRSTPDGRDLESEEPLWRKLWASVPTIEQLKTLGDVRRVQPAHVFPWMAPTRVSDGPHKAITTPQDVHPLQAFFGLPRRMRLEFGGPGRCDLTGIEDERTIVGFRTRPNGVEYSGWRHPLSPYYYDKAGDEWRPVHGQPTGLPWKDWIGLTLEKPVGAERKPASAVSHYLRERAGHVGSRELRLHVFGYDVDNAKARGWIDAIRPAFAATDAAHRARMVDTAQRLTEGTSIAGTALLSAVDRALFQRPEDAPGDRSQVKSQLWDATESEFFRIMRLAADTQTTYDDIEAACGRFSVRSLERSAGRIFDHWCPVSGIAPQLMRRMVAARFGLVMTLRGCSKLGDKLFAALGVPNPCARRSALDIPDADSTSEAVA